MGLRINTNVASLAAQNNLSKTTKKLNQSLTRLSTGLRINTGKDDVVGLAKSETLRSQIRGGDVARNNIANAGAVLGVAEGYLSQLTEISQSIRDLAVQAADGTLSSADRTALGDNLTSLLNEYDRLAQSANFNGVKLLDGSFSGKGIQVGTNEGEQISVSIDDARSSTIGKVAVLTSQTRTATGTTSGATLDFGAPAGITIAGVSLASTDFTADGVSNADSDESAIAYVNAINSKAGQSGVTAVVLANVQTFTYTSGSTLAATAGLVINGVTVKSNSTAYTNSDADMTDLVALINTKSTQTGVTATIETGSDKIVMTAADGRNIDIRVTGTTEDTTASANVMGAMGNSTNRAVAFRGTFKLLSDDAFTVAGAADEFASGASVSVALSDSTTLDNVSFDTAADAATAISIMDKVLAQLQTRRGEVGSVANRLDIADAEMASRLENLSAAQSAIRDADVAAETAKYTQSNILQQAGATVLAQANSSPQIALTLLQSL